MLKRSHFTVDVWFIFGSFCYGAEARLDACKNETLVLQIVSPSPSAHNEMLNFFEQIGEKAKALVRTEVRIFVKSNLQPEPAEDWAEELVVTLLTEYKPRVTQSELGLEVELSDIRGLTPTDQATWVNLVTDIWPQLPS